MPHSGPAPRAAGRRSWWRSGRAAFLSGVAAATALALWMIWPAFRPGRICNLDAPRHLFRAFVMTRQFLPRGHVDGLSHWWYLGAQLFLFQSYGYFFLIGATSLVLVSWLHVTSIEQVFKFWYVLPILVLPGSVALLARRLGVSRRGAVAAAFACLIFTSPLGYGVQGMFGIGLLLQGAGVIAFALAWPEILGVLMEPSRAPWRAVLAVTAVVLCHFISGAYTLAASGFVAAGLALTSKSPRPLIRYALVAGLVLLLAGHSLFPSLELHSMSGQSVGWGSERDRFWRLLYGTLFGAPMIAIPALAAAVWAIFRGPKPLAISALVFFGTGLAGGANEQPWMPPEAEKLIQTLLRPRALPYAALFQAVFAGFAADRLLAAGEYAVGKAGGRIPVERFRLVATPAVLALMLLVGREEIQGQRRFVRTESTLNQYDRTVYLKLVAWLRENVRPPAILAVPRTLLPQSAVGARSIISFLNLDTRLYTLHGDQAELVRASKRSGRVDLDRVDDMRDRNASVLRAAGVSYLILSDVRVRERMIGNKNFELVWQYDQAKGRKKVRGRGRGDPLGVAVYRLRGGNQWLRGAGIEASHMEHSPEHFAWDVKVDSGKPLRPATAALNWHPNWKATVDGEPVPTRMTPARRVQFDVPDGASRVSLDFVRTPREKLWNALSLATLVFVVVAWWRSARARTDHMQEPAGSSPRSSS